MPEYLRPGVFIEEIERGPRPIEGVPTSTAAVLGAAERGSTRPRLVTSYKEYQRNFGSVFGPSEYLPYAMAGFFENGGKRAYVCRIVGENATPATLEVGNFIMRAAGPGAWGRRVFVAIRESSTRKKDNTPVGFRISAAYFAADARDIYNPFEGDGPTRIPRPQLVEDFDDLVIEEGSPDYYGKRVPFIDAAKSQANVGPDSSALFVLVRTAAAAPTDAPDQNAGSLLTEGGEDDLDLDSADYIGRVAGSRTEEQGLSALELDAFRDVALVYAPNAQGDTANKIVEHCDKLRFRFAILDAPKNQANFGDVNPRLTLGLDSSYAGYYYPWIQVNDPVTGARKLVPPGGHVLGVYARTDVERGVFKAPANEIVRGAIDLEYDIRDNDQETLNPRGVNAIRRFPGRGIRVWGARTLSSNALWKYVSVRRLFIFLERSIYEGTQWVVFEPNDPRLWARVTDTVRLFLRNQWREGALFGRREEEAFFVACNLGTTMSQDDILNGRLVCEIGIAPVRPAEFVVFRIFQNTAEAQR